MRLVNVASILRNGKDFESNLLIDLDRITEPVYENVNNQSVIHLNETPNLHNQVNQGINNVQYIVEETLAEFIALNTKSIFFGTVLHRNGNIPVISDLAFITYKIVKLESAFGMIGGVDIGSKFLYEEQGGVTPVEYILNETVRTILIAMS